MLEALILGEEMSDRLPKIHVAVVQAAPVLFDRDATIDKACRLIHDAASQGAQLVLLPEAFVPAYPRGLGFGMVVGSRSPVGRRIWQRYWENAVEIPSSATEILGEAVREAGVYLAIGIIERDSRFSRGTLYCTLLYFSPDGQIAGKHRKLKPTGAERLIWGEGDGSTLTVLDTEYGKIGGLICWENYMPLARMALYGKGVEVYLAPTARQPQSAGRPRPGSSRRSRYLKCRRFRRGRNSFWSTRSAGSECRKVGRPGSEPFRSGWRAQDCASPHRLHHTSPHHLNRW